MKASSTAGHLLQHSDFSPSEGKHLIVSSYPTVKRLSSKVYINPLYLPSTSSIFLLIIIQQSNRKASTYQTNTQNNFQDFLKVPNTNIQNEDLCHHLRPRPCPHGRRCSRQQALELRRRLWRQLRLQPGPSLLRRHPDLRGQRAGLRLLWHRLLLHYLFACRKSPLCNNTYALMVKRTLIFLSRALWSQSTLWTASLSKCLRFQTLQPHG